MRSSSTGRPKSNSWFPTAAAATPSALNASTTARPWNWLEMSVPWNSSPASMSSASPPRSRASRRMASIQPPSHSAPPRGSLVQAASERGPGAARSAPCTSLIPTMARRRRPARSSRAWPFGSSRAAGAEQAAANSRVGKNARRGVMRGIVADPRVVGSGRTSESGELAQPRLGLAPLRDHGHEPQQRRARAPHHGRGLAQQPPPLHELGEPGLLLVGIRPQLLPDPPVPGARPGLGGAHASREGPPRPPRRRERHRRRRPGRLSRANGARAVAPPRPRLDQERFRGARENREHGRILFKRELPPFRISRPPPKRPLPQPQRSRKEWNSTPTPGGLWRRQRTCAFTETVLPSGRSISATSHSAPSGSATRR